MDMFLVFPTYLIFLFVLHPTIKSELFTSTIHLEELVKTEAVLMKNLKRFIHSEEQRLNTLKRNIKVFKQESSKASENIEQYVSNPLNAFLLIKRLTTDFKKVKTLLESDLSSEQFENLIDKNVTKFPDEEDLTGAAIGIMKLQHIYHISTSSLAKGEIKGVKLSPELSASDCFELGKQLHNTGDYEYALMWLDEAYSRFDYKIGDASKLIDLQKYLASAKFYQKVAPHKNLQPTPQQNLKINKDISLLSKVYGIKMEVDKISVLEQENRVLQFLAGNIGLPATTVEELTTKLCNADISLSNEKAATLKCRYFKGNNPFLTVAPFKVEEAHHQPDIFIFYNVISDKEIDIIKKIALPKLRTSWILGLDGLGKSFARTAKTSFLRDTDHKLLPILSQRISDMTGLNMEFAEPLNAINYGIGGVYEPHYDARSASEDTGDIVSSDFAVRVATVLLYMSNVEEGGATVFPLLNVTVWPRKGSAIVWHNLLSDGRLDKLTLHVGCPVLLGSKWIATKWIREKGQEFVKPCSLKKHEPILFG